MNGFLNVIKPPAMSSAAVVGFVKRLTKEKCGHAGTLDPEACGVLPVMVGRATRLLDHFTDRSKEYVALLSFTGATDTQDAQGALIAPGKRIPEREEVQRASQRFVGDILQRPPAYSAIKQNGVPLYALARAGKDAVAKERPARVDAIDLLDQLPDGDYRIRVRCGEGTYIRTLCHDIGQALDCPAHMKLLIRSRSGAFAMRSGVTLEELQAAAVHERLSQMLLPLDYPLSGLRRIDLTGSLLKKALNGVRLPLGCLPIRIGEEACIYGDGELIGIALGEEDMIRFPVLLTSAVEYCARHPAR